jgi:DNA-binding beta-propeller fold protein YncE
MSKMKIVFFALALVFLAVLSVQAQPPAPAKAGPYYLAQTFHVGGEGGWDYITVDPAHQLLFVPRTTHTMVLSETTGKLVADIPGQARNHGVALVPSFGRGFITDGKDASVTIFDLKTYQVLGKVKAEDDADGIIYDPASGKVLVVCGDAGVMIPISPDVDPQAGKADAAVKLGGKPEFLAADGHGKVYVNLVDKNEVAVVDSKTMKVEARWPTAPGGAPVGMAIDQEHHRLFIGCRNPQKLIVMNAENGKILADLPIGAGVDATRFDGYSFASCRDGSLAIARETSPGKFEVVQTVETPKGARTMDVDPSTHTVYLPTAEFETPADARARPVMKADSFMILVVAPTKK